MIFLSLLLFFSKDEESEEKKEERKIPKKEIGMLLGIGAFILLYIMFLEVLGFVVTTVLFIYLCSWFLGYKNHIVNGIVSILLPVGLYFMFTEFLKISLPSGILPF